MKVFSEYPDLAVKASKTLLPFPTSYLCESRFSVMAATKPQNRQDVRDILRVSLSSIIPRWERLVGAKQAQDSHWIKVVIIYTSCNKYSLPNIRGFLNAGPRKNFSFKPVRSGKKVPTPVLNKPGSRSAYRCIREARKQKELWRHINELSRQRRRPNNYKLPIGVLI